MSRTRKDQHYDSKRKTSRARSRELKESISSTLADTKNLPDGRELSDSEKEYSFHWNFLCEG